MASNFPEGGGDALDDEVLIDFYMKEKVKQLKRKLSPSELNAIKAEYMHAHNIGANVGSMKFELKNLFGTAMDEKLIESIGDLVEKHPALHLTNQRKLCRHMVLDVLKLVHAHYMHTPRCVDNGNLGVIDLTEIDAAANRPIKRPARPIKHFNVQGRVLFPENLDSDKPISQGFEGKHTSDASIPHHSKGPSPTRPEAGDDITCAQVQNFEWQEKSTEVVFVKEITSEDRAKQMRGTVENIYNESMMGSKDARAGPSNALQSTPPKQSEKSSSGMSFVSGQIPGISGQVCADDLALLSKDSKFPVSPYQVRVYNIVCSLARSKHAGATAVDIGLCTVKYFSLGDSMALDHEVCTFVINCMCRKFFLDTRPTVSLRHYFFSSVSADLMGDSTEYVHVGKCFTAAAKVLPLRLCSALLFPVLHCEHWFLFVVDLSRKMFLILDPLFSKNDDFSVATRNKLIPSFCNAWNKFVHVDMGFNQFRFAYPHVPKQANKKDCGVFVLKFLELWKPGVYMPNCFSHEDIPFIRVQIVDELLNSPHNKADLEIIRNF